LFLLSSSIENGAHRLRVALSSVQLHDSPVLGIDRPPGATKLLLMPDSSSLFLQLLVIGIFVSIQFENFIHKNSTSKSGKSGLFWVKKRDLDKKKILVIFEKNRYFPVLSPPSEIS
jgi:hypothetical protein